MLRKFWTFAVAFLFIISLASVVDAQMRRGNGQRRAPGDFGQNGKPGNRDQSEDPGNGNQGEDPGNGNQGEDPAGDPPGGTPDGETPAEEDTCDDLKHGTPGLYGLCIAFCEAHDCVPDFSKENPFSTCKKNDRKILDKYRKKMQDGDPDMPCLPSAGEDPQYACPCWSQEDLEYFPFYMSSLASSATDEQYGSCGVDEDFSNTDEDDDGNVEVLCEQTGSYINEMTFLDNGVPFVVDLFASAGECDGFFCSSFIGCQGGGCDPEFAIRDYFSMELDEDEYLNCRASIEQLTTYCN